MWDDPPLALMLEETGVLTISDGVCVNDPLESHSTVDPLQEPFLIFDVNSELSFKDKSVIYRSLVALMKDEYPFDKALLDKAVQFLKSLEPKWGDHDYAAKLVTDLVPSSDKSFSGFIESILTLLSSLYLTVVTAALSVLHRTVLFSSPAVGCRLVKSDLITKVLATVQPHTPRIAGNEEIIDNLIVIIGNSIRLALPSSLIDLDITDAVDIFNHREMIFQKTVLPSSPFVTFLISNRYALSGDLFLSFMSLLSTLLRTCPFHRPTLEFVLSSPIAMAFSSCLSFVNDDMCLWIFPGDINNSLELWKTEDPEMTESRKRMFKAKFSEGFEDTLEQIMKFNKDGHYSSGIVNECHLISQKQGSNVEIPEE